MGIYLNNSKTVFLALLLLIISLLYSSTFHGPFNYDDEVVIKHETVHQFGSYKDGKADAFTTKLYPLQYRHLFYSSLVLNYSLGELRPFGYHLVNTTLHLFTSIVIFFIAFITIKNGLSLNRKDALSIASTTALFF